MRFIFQPAVAIFFGIRTGISDARAGRKPYILGVLFDSEQRRTLLKEAFERLSVLIAMSILLDALSQFLILHEVFPGPALIVRAGADRHAVFVDSRADQSDRTTHRTESP